MHQNPTFVSQSILDNGAYSNTYDPSTPYRALFAPPPPVTTDIPPNYQYSSNPNLYQEAPPPNHNQPRHSEPLIPQYYYVSNDDPNGYQSTRQNNQQPVETNPNLTRIPYVYEQAVPHETIPPSQPTQVFTDPYYNYSTPYLIPVTDNVAHTTHVTSVREPLKPTNVISSQQADTNLSRLEVYHFTPKQNPPIQMATVPDQFGQPLAPYYNYAYPAISATLPPPQPQQYQEQYPPYPSSYYDYSPYSYPNVPYNYSSYDYPPYAYSPYDHTPYDQSYYGSPYYSEPPRSFLPPIVTKARGSQTETPHTKTRGVSPMHSHSTAFDKAGYPSIHQRTMFPSRQPGATENLNQHHGPIEHSNQHFRNRFYSTPLPDCRCIHCQRERAKPNTTGKENMNSQLVIVLLVGLAASAYALDLSHANKRSVETEPRLFSILSDFYAQVVYKPLNHVVTSLALLTAQVLAGVAENGIPAPGGRILHPSDAQLRNFFTDLWNNAIKPPVESALSGFSLLAAQVLAGLGTNGVNLGKRDLTEAEMRGFLDALTDALNSVYTGVIQKPLEQALSGGALMLAQVLAGLGTNGVDLSSLIGKRDLTEAEMRGFFDTLAEALNSVYTGVIQKPLEQALSGGALMLAQVLAGLGTNGVNLGKRDLTEAEMRGFFDTLAEALNSVYSGVIQKPLEQALSGGALMLAQVLAGLGTNGVNLGKRDLTEAEMRGFFDALTEALNSVYSGVIQKPLEQALSGGALMLAQVLAGLGTNGVDLSSLLGKRGLSELAGREEELRGFFDTLGQGLLDGLQSVWSSVLQNPLEQALSSGALLAAQVLAGLGTNGVNLGSLFGKRALSADARGPIFNDLVAHASGLIQTQVKPVLESALNNAAIHLAGVLANFSQSGLGRR